MTQERHKNDTRTTQERVPNKTSTRKQENAREEARAQQGRDTHRRANRHQRAQRHAADHTQRLSHQVLQTHVPSYTPLSVTDRPLFTDLQADSPLFTDLQPSFHSHIKPIARQNRPNLKRKEQFLVCRYQLLYQQELFNSSTREHSCACVHTTLFVLIGRVITICIYSPRPLCGLNKAHCGLSTLIERLPFQHFSFALIQNL